MLVKKLLLVIDMQEGFRSSASENIIPNILALSKKFENSVIYSQFVNEKGSLFDKQLNWKKFTSEQDISVLTELQSVASLKLTHSTYTVLNSKLQMYIKENSVRQVYIAGVYTDVCVLKTAMDLFDYGMEVFIVADACASLHGEEHHQWAIDSLKHILGKNHIITTENI